MKKYKLYDCINGTWFSTQEYTEEQAKSYLLRHQDNEAFRDGDFYFAPSDGEGDYDGDIIELRDLVNDLA